MCIAEIRCLVLYRHIYKNTSLPTSCSQVLKDMMTAIDADSSGTVSLQEWVEGGMNNIPLLVLLGLKVRKQLHVSSKLTVLVDYSY